MTGAEHYTQAGHLAAEAEATVGAAGRAEPMGWAMRHAQVLATLAAAHAGLAEAAAVADVLAGGSAAERDATSDAWEAAIRPAGDPLAWWRLAARQTLADGTAAVLPGRTGESIRLVIAQLGEGR